MPKVDGKHYAYTPEGMAAAEEAKKRSTFTMKYQGNTSAFPFKLEKPDMSKLRAKQARSSKGVSEWQHFKQPSQGDEPNVEYSMKKKK